MLHLNLTFQTLLFSVETAEDQDLKDEGEISDEEKKIRKIQENTGLRIRNWTIYIYLVQCFFFKFPLVLLFRSWWATVDTFLDEMLPDNVRKDDNVDDVKGQGDCAIQIENKSDELRLIIWYIWLKNFCEWWISVKRQRKVKGRHGMVVERSLKVTKKS